MTQHYVNNELVDLTTEEEAEHLSSQLKAALIEWQERMGAHDAKWTKRMLEDFLNVTSGAKSLQELRDAADVLELPYEWWLKEKEIIRSEMP